MGTAGTLLLFRALATVGEFGLKTRNLGLVLLDGSMTFGNHFGDLIVVVLFSGYALLEDDLIDVFHTVVFASEDILAGPVVRALRLTLDVLCDFFVISHVVCHLNLHDAGDLSGLEVTCDLGLNARVLLLGAVDLDVRGRRSVVLHEH